MSNNIESTQSDDDTPRSQEYHSSVLSEETLSESFPKYDGQIVETHHLTQKPAQTTPAEAVLPESLTERISNELFEHQATALAALADDENVVVTTSTSSGKTWVYALQIARMHLYNPETTALCLYPMKALTRDQERELNNKLRDDWGLDVKIGVYDGDTPTDRKREIRESADVILTNPAGLNVYLPRHNRDSGWRRFYANLDLIVVDEAHEYAGVTGTHVAWILRRLRRIVRAYDANPQFVLTTATIGNPADHARRLTGELFTVIDEDGSPRGSRDIVLWEPPVDWDQITDDDEKHTAATDQAGSTKSGASESDPAAEFERARQSTGSEAAQVTAHLASHNTQTLQFCSARQGTEIAAKQTLDTARSSDNLAVEPYHAGLGKRLRRRVENGLKDGRLDAVATTNALELGIDIGSVDATVTAGYPGTKQSFWQQIGRAGRGTTDALSVLVGGDDAIDAYIFDHPSYLFNETVEDAVVSVDNEPVYADHLLAAADERPLSDADAGLLGSETRLRETVQMWQDAGVLEQTGRLDGTGVGYAGDPRPQGRLSLYNTSGREFAVICIDTDAQIDHDPVAAERAYRDYHEGALFLHAGQQYEVVNVDDESSQPRILVKQTNTGKYTQTLSTKQITELHAQEHHSLAGAYDRYFGRGTVKITYDQYLVRQISTGEVVRGPLPTQSPPMELNTELMWVSLPPNHVASTIDRLDVPLLSPTARSSGDTRVPDEAAQYTYGGGIHAAEHGLIQLAPLELLVDNNDIGGLSTLNHPHETVSGPVWFIHDGIDGGIGFTRAIYDHFETLTERTRDHIAQCRCDRRRGCPLCIMSEDCGNNNDPLDRATGKLILNDVLAAI
ncbi:DEAD/DEAH box helicase [Haloquadratum walsbyi]|jgi:DEAD/DEAH box helicase domain-containing protein|uniref:Probable DEAD/DEAH box helicase n=1 Tax=Haloquadratum walsbyi (strain DSM 16790 / HBSQ001) TaxID=362976 RepID=Q18J32_HALWD|nr:DEAD/DEAH box helicase [Haloquadratum walsbyi]CAJ51979.1 probable DEAD/DEAH box helicase [Haloquadratum walsbyi DSM 16790]